MELDKDTLDKLIAHFNSVLSELRNADDEEDEEFPTDPAYSMGYDSGFMSGLIHLELLRDGEMQLRS